MARNSSFEVQSNARSAGFAGKDPQQFHFLIYHIFKIAVVVFSFFSLSIIYSWAEIGSDSCPSNRLAIVVLGFTSENGGPENLSRQVGIDWSIFSAIKQIPLIHLLTADDLPCDSSSDSTEIQKVGRQLNARFVVWGNYLYTNQTWTIRLKILNLDNANHLATVSIRSTNWAEAQISLAKNIFQAIDVDPTQSQWRAIHRRWAVSASALEDYDYAELLNAEGKSPEEQERWVRLAIKADSSFADGYARLAHLMCVVGRIDDAESAVLTAIKIAPDLAINHKEYGYVLFSQKKYREAFNELRMAAQIDPDDAVTFEHLGDVEILLGLASGASEDYTKALKLDPYSSSRQYLQNQIQFCLLRAAPTFFTNAPPEEYTDMKLRKTLRQLLTLGELRLIENPLSANAEMRVWAQMVTKGGGNDFEKARMLFQEIVQHAYSADSFLGPSNSLTAEEIFFKMRASDTSLNCQECTLLFVSLARAAGLRSFCVQVDQGYDGRKILHACAAVYLGGKMLLVDPACFWFGVPHREFTVLSDIQATGIYLSTFSDLERRQIAAKLAPRIPLVLFNLCLKLDENKQQARAKRLLPLLVAYDANGALSASLDGDIALHDGRYAQAISLFQDAIKIEPEETFFMQLARAYLVGGKVVEARGVLVDALRTNHTAEDAAEIGKYISVIDQLAQDYYQRGRRDFEAGDFASARTNFDAAIEIEPEFAEAYASRGFIEQEKSNFDGALADYTKALALKPHWREIYEYRAYLEQKRSNFNAAVADYSQAIKLKPDSAEDYINRAGLEWVKGDLDGAEADNAQGAKLNTNSSTNAATAFKFLGWRRYDRQEYTNALSDFRRAAELAAMDEYSSFGVWLSSSRLGETESATRELKEYLANRQISNSDDWPSQIGRFLTDQITSQELLTAAQSADTKKDKEQHCEAYFYIGSKRLIAGDKAGAAASFEKCVATGVHGFSEYQTAKVELRLLENAN